MGVEYIYKGTLFYYPDSGKKIFHEFEIVKFTEGKYLKSKTGWDQDGKDGWQSPNYIHSVFDLIAKEKTMTIAKKSNHRIDADIKKLTRSSAKGAVISFKAEANFNSGKYYIYYATFPSAELISNTNVRETGLGNLFIATFYSDGVTVSALKNDDPK
jgi:hypothetical protein